MKKAWRRRLRSSLRRFMERTGSRSPRYVMISHWSLINVRSMWLTCSQHMEIIIISQELSRISKWEGLCLNFYIFTRDSAYSHLFYKCILELHTRNLSFYLFRRHNGRSTHIRHKDSVVCLYVWPKHISHSHQTLNLKEHPKVNIQDSYKSYKVAE